MKGLRDRAILVAGGGGGIGAATARRLAAEGARVAVGDLDEVAARSVVTDIERAGGKAIAIGYDQADESSIGALIKEAVAQLGALDGLHANAADLSPETIGRDRNILKMDVAVWERTMKVNLIGTAVLVREVLPHLLQQGGGAIVCTSSDGSEMGQPAQPAYASSKAGINALIRHVAKRWGPDGVRANAVSPGIVLSESARQIQTEETLASYQASTPSFRLGEPDDIAGCVAYLMSDDAVWVNGQVWSVDGGLVTRG